jgi:LmbE family N-acetylglucosaminyl deacetylase
MLHFRPEPLVERRLNVLCLGAHCDDIEIGCGGTILRLSQRAKGTQFDWVVFCSDYSRGKETARAAQILCDGIANVTLHLLEFKDGYLPQYRGEAKMALEGLAGQVDPDMIFTHYGGDAHQDHRVVSEITWNLFRDHQVFEYEIPKYDGDLGRPNAFVPLTEKLVNRKIAAILDSFESQKHKHWFNEETFRSLMRLRGLESGRQNEYAEAYYCRKLSISI